MEKRKIDLLKVLGAVAAVFLIMFGGVDNAWRTARYWWYKMIG